MHDIVVYLPYSPITVISLGAVVGLLLFKVIYKLVELIPGM